MPPSRADLPAVPHHLRAPGQPACAGAGAEGLGRNAVNWIVEQIVAPPRRWAPTSTASTTCQIGDRTYNGHRIDDIVERARHQPARRRHAAPGRDPRAAARRRRRRAASRASTPGDVITPDDVEVALARHRPGGRARRRRAVPHRLGPPAGTTTPTATSPASRARPGAGRVARRPSASRSPAATPGATGRCRRGPRRAVRRAADPQRPPRRRRGGEPAPARSSPTDGVSEFMLVVSHPKLAGATGVVGRPARRSSEPRGRHDMTDHYDVIVIGSGAGGGTLTHALRRPASGSCILERGDCLPRETRRTGTPGRSGASTATATPATGPTRHGPDVHPEAALLRRRQHQGVRRGAVPHARA